MNQATIDRRWRRDSVQASKSRGYHHKQKGSLWVVVLVVSVGSRRRWGPMSGAKQLQADIAAITAVLKRCARRIAVPS